MSRKSAKRSAGKFEETRFAIDRSRLRQPSIDAELPRNPVFDAIGKGLVTLGQKVTSRALDPGQI